MDASISSLENTRVVDLGTDFIEELELTRKLDVIITSLVIELMPILRYIVIPMMIEEKLFDVCQVNNKFTIRAIVIAEENEKDMKHYFPWLRENENIILLLDENGSFALATNFNSGSCQHYSLRRPDGTFGRGVGKAWEYFRFGAILCGIQKFLRDAIAKREAYLDSIKARSGRINRILAEVIK